jgi:hypothetical protein
VSALELLGAADADEAQKVRAQLVQDYPREARAAGVKVPAAVADRSAAVKPRSENPDLGHPAINGPLGGAGDSSTSKKREVGQLASGESHLSNDTAVAKMGHPGSGNATHDDGAVMNGAPGCGWAVLDHQVRTHEGAAVNGAGGNRSPIECPRIGQRPPPTHE